MPVIAVSPKTRSVGGTQRGGWTKPKGYLTLGWWFIALKERAKQSLVRKATFRESLYVKPRGGQAVGLRVGKMVHQANGPEGGESRLWGDASLIAVQLGARVLTSCPKQSIILKKRL